MIFQNSSVLISKSLSSCLKSPGPDYREPWIGIVTRRPSEWRYKEWPPWKLCLRVFFAVQARNIFHDPQHAIRSLLQYP